MYSSSFELLSHLLGPWVINSSFVSYKGIQGRFEKLWMSGAGSAEELETLRLSRQGCVEVPLASTDPCLPLSNPTPARICLHLKSLDLIVTINLRVVLKARNFGACDHGRHGYHLRVEDGPAPRIGYEQGRAVAAAVEGDVSESMPASMLRSHPDAVLFLDEGAASDLGHGVAG